MPRAPGCVRYALRRYFGVPWERTPRDVPGDVRGTTEIAEHGGRVARDKPNAVCDKKNVQGRVLVRKGGGEGILSSSETPKKNLHLSFQCLPLSKFRQDRLFPPPPPDQTRP